MKIAVGSGYSRRLRAVFLALGFFLAVHTAAGALQLLSAQDPSLNPPAGGNGESGLPIISPDGRYVLFASAANNLVLISNRPMPVARPPTLNVFLRDRTNGATTLVSANLASAGGGNGDSLPAGISADGRYALFTSLASDLVVGDTNNVGDVFVRDLINHTTALVSVATNGTSGNGVSRDPVMTPDGRYVAFVSAATNLVASDTNGIPDVFVRDLQSGTTKLASVGAMAMASYPIYTYFPSSSESPDLTPDGRYVAFYSSATNLISGFTNAGEVYVRDLVAETTVWASTNARSLFLAVVGNSNAVSCNHKISTNGQFVAFETCPSMPSYSKQQGVICRCTLSTGSIDCVYTNANVPLGTQFQDMHTLDMTPDGRFIAYVANIRTNVSPAIAIYLWDSQTATSSVISANTNNTPSLISICVAPSVDSSGRYVAFLSSAWDLATNALTRTNHLYLRDTHTGLTRLVDAGLNGGGTGINPLTVPALSADGSSVAFECADGTLVPDDNNRENDVFVRDLATDTTSLVSTHDPALPSLSPNGYSVIYPTSVSTNGRYVTFVSDGNNLAANDTNGTRDVFVRDLSASTNFLVSADTNGFAGAGMSGEPSISADGRYVAFSSFASNLVAGDTNKMQDIFVRDLQAGTNLLVSVSTNGGFGNNDSYSPVISADGRFVLFSSTAQNLAAGSFGSGTENLFLRDQVLGTNYALTFSGVISAVMTPDGRQVAFVGYVNSGNLYLYIWDTQTARRLYTNSTYSFSNSLVSISPDGRWLAYFASPSTLYGRDLIAKTNWTIATGGFTSHAGLKFSSDGRFLAYATATNNSFLAQNVYLYDFQTGTNFLVSRAYNSSGTPNGSSDSPGISADGRYVAYRSLASNCVPNDLNDFSDVFLYDRLAGATALLSPNQTNSTAANSSSFTPVFSPDGQVLFFQSWASDLVNHDGNERGDIFTLNLPAPAITDTDADGMDDQWELDHFGTLTRDGTGDFDNDGATDLFEFLTGTNPTDLASVFRAQIVYTGTSGQNPLLTWPAVPGKSYTVQYKNTLADTIWQSLNGNVALIGNTGYAADLVPPIGQRFYRVALVNY